MTKDEHSFGQAARSMGAPRTLLLAESQSEIWEHVKSGGLYRIVSTQGINENDMTRVTIYRSLWDGAVWVRPEEQFFDGRFRCLSIDEVRAKYSVVE